MPERSPLYRLAGKTKLSEEGRCRMCLTPRASRGERQLTRHHIVPQSWFSDRIARAGADLRLHADRDWLAIRDEQARIRQLRDCDDNIVPLCVACHRAVESDDAARAMLRKVLGSAEVAFALSTRGRAWFDLRYVPLRDLAAARPVHGEAVAAADVADPERRPAARVQAVGGPA